MNLKKLTFAQAHKLVSPENIVRLHTAYAKQLHRLWIALGTKELFMVSSAAYRFTEIKHRWMAIWALIDKDGPVCRKLVDLARNAKPEVTDKFLVYDTVEVSNYHSQGYGKMKYAECKARLLAAHLQDCCVPSEVQLVEENNHKYFLVLARTNEAGKTILRYKPGLPLREIVRLCWKHGCQPRVFYWWLPYEFEQDNGLDYFGGFKTPALNPSAAMVNVPDARDYLQRHNYLISEK